MNQSDESDSVSLDDLSILWRLRVVIAMKTQTSVCRRVLLLKASDSEGDDANAATDETILNQCTIKQCMYYGTRKHVANLATINKVLIKKKKEEY